MKIDLLCSQTWIEFGTHIGNAVNKANQLVDLYEKPLLIMTKKWWKKLFTSIVRPHLKYGNIIWYPQHKKDVNLIERVRRRATKLIPELKSLNHETRLLD